MKLIVIALLTLSALAGVVSSDTCPSVDGLGSPINLLHQHMENLYKSLNVSSTEDEIKLLYFTEKDVGNRHGYQMMFSLRQGNTNTEMFIGLTAMPANASGSSIGVPYSITKYIESDNPNEVKTVLGVRDAQPPNGFPCNDFKTQFSKFLTEKNAYSFSGIFRNQAAWAMAGSQKTVLAAATNTQVMPAQSPEETGAKAQPVSATEGLSGNESIFLNVEGDQTPRIVYKVISQTPTQPAKELPAAAPVTQTIVNQAPVVATAKSGGATPISININNQVITDASAPTATVAAKASDRDAGKTNSLTKSVSPELKTLPGNDASGSDDGILNFNYSFINSWYDKYYSSTQPNQKPAAASTAPATVDTKTAVLATINNRSDVMVAPESAPKRESVSQTVAVQNTQVSNSNFVNNNFGTQNLALLSRYPVYEQIDLAETTGSSNSANRDKSKDKNSFETGKSAAVTELLNKGLTYEQIIQVLRQNKDAEEAQRQIDNAKRESKESQKAQLIAQKQKDEQEFLQKLYLLLSYRKRQEESASSANTKVRPTEYLYNNLYGNSNKLPSTLGQQNFYTVIPDNLSVSSPELNPYLSLSSGDLTRIISQKEKYISTLDDKRSRENSQSGGRGSTSFSSSAPSVSFAGGLPASVSHVQNQFFNSYSADNVTRLSANDRNPTLVVSASNFNSFPFQR